MSSGTVLTEDKNSNLERLSQHPNLNSGGEIFKVSRSPEFQHRPAVKGNAFLAITEQIWINLETAVHVKKIYILRRIN